jgi:hypothetical protein
MTVVIFPAMESPVLLRRFSQLIWQTRYHLVQQPGLNPWSLKPSVVNVKPVFSALLRPFTKIASSFVLVPSSSFNLS